MGKQPLEELKGEKCYAAMRGQFTNIKNNVTLIKIQFSFSFKQSTVRL